jgi:hypothetical protein
MDKHKNRKRRTVVILKAELGLQFLYFHSGNMKTGTVNDLLRLNKQFELNIAQMMDDVPEF